MKARALFAILVVISMLITSVGFAQDLVESTIEWADDGPRFHRNVSRTADEMTGASQMSVMSLYVPAQNPLGELVEIEYLTGDVDSSTVDFTMTEAKPLIVSYNDGVGEADLGTGAGFGQRDAFVAMSLDDGATWKNWNISDSALRSSFVLKNGQPYPGDVFKLVHQVEGNRVAVAWVSRFCESGAPLYSWADEDKDLLLAEYTGLVNEVTVVGASEPYNLYTDDLFGVAGTQKSVDYTLQGFPEVGEIPYGCVWAARGTLEQDSSTGLYDIVWRAAERLTSGVRDPHQINITSAPGAGFIIEWQEDPDGLRPGKGLGPGEGWSGAIANAKTDIWYTYIDLDHFDDVVIEEAFVDPATEPVDWFNLTEKPKIAVPFAVPVRLTDNNMCKANLAEGAEGYLPYCYADFNSATADGGTSAADLCATSVTWTNAAGIGIPVCVAEDGRVMNGRTASTRVRWAMKSFDSDADGEPDSAWVLLGEEKMKALGTELEDPDTGERCEPDANGNYDPDCVPVDIGKNMWYHTFKFNEPELVQQGLILNAPAINPETDLPFELQTDEWGFDFYDTEIARRFNLFVNSPTVAQVTPSRTAGILIYKQGILFQGGPADIFIRRVVLPTDFDPAEDNPFDYDNVQCMAYADDGTATELTRLYADGSNPNYVRGICPESGMNISGTTIVECDSGSTSADTCADEFPFDMTYEEWASDADETQLPKVTEWVQATDNFNDETWANPYDVSKGHRGFIDGDFIMMMYATAPNWKAGTTGNEAYNLYIRRSFDGGVTWTTLPSSYVHWDGTTLGELGVTADGTTTCEDYGWGGQIEEETCTFYPAGDFEQARNVSRLTGSKITVLDPRYSPSGGMLKLDYKSLLCDDDQNGVWENCGYTDDGSAPYPQEIRDPSAFFVTYETGDNTVVSVETGANPLDMYYSRAWNFGDDYGALPVTVSSTGVVENRWDWLENGEDWATEASVYGNPDGSKFYAVWNQELPVDVEHDIYTNMDTEFRRIYYNLDSDATPVDALPSSAIVYVSTDKVDLSTDTEDIVLVGYARDHDNLGAGIVSEGWWVTIKEDSHYYEGRTFQSPPSGFIPGKHDFGFQAQDNEGNWTRPKTVTIWVAEKFYNTYLPIVTR